VNGSQLDQAPLSGPKAIPGGVITTTDDPNTGTGTALPGTDVTDPVASNADLNFETGLLEVIIPTNISFLPPTDPVLPVPAPERAAVAEVQVQIIQQFIPNNGTDFPASSFSSQSEDFFQLRQSSTEPIEGFERIDPDVGWKLLQPKRLKEWVFENDLDGRGYELWLITTKVKDSRDITFELPVLKFDVFDNQPFPKEEEILNQLPELKLEPVEVDENGNVIEPTGEESGEGTEPAANANEPPQTSMNRLVPETNDVRAEVGLARSALAGLAVSTILRDSRRSRVSPLASAVSKILSRVRR